MKKNEQFSLGDGKPRPFTINTANIDALISSIKKQVPKPKEAQYIIFPRTMRGEINRKVYRGRGRPRKNDYHRISMMKTLRKIARESSSVLSTPPILN